MALGSPQIVRCSPATIPGSPHIAPGIAAGRSRRRRTIRGERQVISGQQEMIRCGRQHILGERRAISGQRGMICGEQQMMPGERQLAHGEHEDICGERELTCGERRTIRGLRQAAQAEAETQRVRRTVAPMHDLLLSAPAMEVPLMRALTPWFVRRTC